MTRFACFLLVSLFCISRANAQNIYGTSSISFNASANTGAADCETDLDAEADDGYYAARVTCVVRDPNGNTVATGAYSDDGDRDGYAAVSLSFSTTPGVTYTVTGGHSAAVTVPYDAPEGQPAEYFDEYNFENYVESPNQEIADDYDWFGPGPEMETRQHSISLPPTTAQGTAPQTPTSAATMSSTLATYNNQTVYAPNSNPPQVLATNAYGYGRTINYQILDQANPGKPINSTFTVHEVITDIYSNFGSNQNTGDNSSNANGIFTDFVALFGHSAPPSNACAYAKQTFSVQNVSIRVNCIHYSATDATVTDITSNPSSCVSTCP